MGTIRWGMCGRRGKAYDDADCDPKSVLQHQEKDGLICKIILKLHRCPFLLLGNKRSTEVTCLS